MVFFRLCVKLGFAGPGRYQFAFGGVVNQFDFLSGGRFGPALSALVIVNRFICVQFIAGAVFFIVTCVNLPLGGEQILLALGQGIIGAEGVNAVVVVYITLKDFFGFFFINNPAVTGDDAAQRVRQGRRFFFF